MRILLGLFAALLMTGSLLRAEERIALVIGNGNYAALPSLQAPVPDALLMAETLRLFGFRVTLVRDATRFRLNAAIAEFGRNLREAGPDSAGLFYYAGHAVQNFGTNYLMPTDARPAAPADLDFVAVDAQTILRQVFSAGNATNIVIFDANRPNPLGTLPGFEDVGLAEMFPPRGTFLVYAAPPGEAAADRPEEGTQFTAALVKQMVTGDPDVETVFENLRRSILSETGGVQVPWASSALTSPFSFRSQAQPDAPETAVRDWVLAWASGDPQQVVKFLRNHPDSTFAAEAQAFLNALLNGSGQGTAALSTQRQGPSDAEAALIATAQATGRAEDYQAYLDAFPNGVFSELAQIELASTAPSAGGQPQGAAQSPVVEGALSFTVPLLSRDPVLSGRSFEDLIAGSPLHPPIEGLPEEIWKDKACTNCHMWTQPDLCTQAQTYLGPNAAKSLAKVHPYGGGFKQALRIWAEAGCP